MNAIFISAAHKSSGKTTITIGLCKALTKRGLTVSPFKKGPDYIDPMWLGMASGRPCYNLDFYTMTDAEIIQIYHEKSRSSDIAIIEGNKGLYDGIDIEGKNCSAALAIQLKVPVVLVIDVQGITRGIAPLLLGYQAFDRNINIAGIILNKVGGTRHEEKLLSVIDYYTDLNILGAIYRNKLIEITERHLGLVPSNELYQDAQNRIETISSIISEQIDIDTILATASQSKETVIPTKKQILNQNEIYQGLKIGVISDAAFGFYYQSDIDYFNQVGAELIYINAINDSILPHIDGLLIGGGFPESFCNQLQENTALRVAIKENIENGLPVYAECGGLMYLSNAIIFDNQKYNMVGAIQADVQLYEKPQGRGYVQLEQTEYFPWPVIEGKNDHSALSGHEFHYSQMINITEQYRYAFNVKRGTGLDGEHDGIIYKNLLASYSHLRHTNQCQWISSYLAFVKQCKVRQ